MRATAAAAAVHAHAWPRLGPVVYTVRSSVLPGWDEEFNRWQREEHAPQLLGVPGYRSMQGFSRADQPHAYMNIWQIDDKTCFDSDTRMRASRTPWRTRIDPIRSAHQVDFYRPLSGDGVVAGPSWATGAQHLVRYDLRRDASADGQGLHHWLSLVAAQPGTEQLRVLTGLTDDTALLVLHHLAAAVSPVVPEVPGLQGTATCWQDEPRR